MDEQIDLYDENRQKLGITINREGAFLEEGQFMLYILAVIQNAEGKYLITQRGQSKSWGAGWWEVTGGGVRAGETTRDAVVREVDEEVGLDVSACELEPVDSYVNVDIKHGSNYIVDIFNFTLDFKPEDLTLLECEIDAFDLVDWDRIVELHEQGIFLHFERLRHALGK